MRAAEQAERGEIAMDADTVYENLRTISADFAAQRRERQRRRELVAADFDRLRDAGFLLTGAPVDHGGIWESVGGSARPICEMLRTVAHGDSSVALVCAMHPAVLNFWMATGEAPAPFQKAWDEQRRLIFRNVCAGAWWGTIASEPGTAGDIARTKATAQRGGSDGAYLLTGQKNFGSGSGITSYMITVAVPEGESGPDMFVLDMRGVPWDGSAGVTLTAAWDGHGMAATQSHAMAFNEFPVTRIAWPGQFRLIQENTGALTQCCFTAVIVGVTEVALEAARQQVVPRRDNLRAYERVEWSKAELEGWLIQQAYEGMLRAMEQDRDRRLHAVRAKAAIAELAESALQRIGKVIGGSTFSRSSPFGYWYEDVRALGFLRPPWGLSYDQLFAT
jgi:alkylation response protein AidB-like acyl-CoA dehydrogenase